MYMYVYIYMYTCIHVIWFDHFDPWVKIAKPLTRTAFGSYNQPIVG